MLLSFFASTCVMIDLVLLLLMLLLLLLLLLLLNGAAVVSGMFYAPVPVRFFFYEKFDDRDERKTAVHVVTCF